MVHYWRHVGVTSLLLLSACESAAERCDRIQAEQMSHDLWSNPNVGGILRADSIPPPPRPSDVAWYRENCWEGKPR